MSSPHKEQSTGGAESLQNRTIIVTGASAGIGKEAARAIHEAGANVILQGRREEILSQLVSEMGERASYVVASLENTAEVARVIDTAETSFGGADGLVNNAAIFPRSDINTDILNQFDEVFAVNVRAPLLLAQGVYRSCVSAGRKGSIVNIGSINAYCGAPFLLVYSMSKGALMTMTRNLGDTLHEHGVRTNQLNVGWTYTDGEIEVQRQAGAPDDWQEKVGKSAAPSGRLLMPEDVARHIVFWLSNESAPVSGTVLEVEQFPVIGRNRDSG